MSGACQGELRRQDKDDFIGDELLFKRAVWALPRAAKKSISQTLLSARSLIDDLDLCVVSMGSLLECFGLHLQHGSLRLPSMSMARVC